MNFYLPTLILNLNYLKYLPLSSFYLYINMGQSESSTVKKVEEEPKEVKGKGE